MFIQQVENNGQWSELCGQGKPCYTELSSFPGAVLMTGPVKGQGRIALLLPCGSHFEVARMKGEGWILGRLRGKGQPSSALRQEISDFLSPLWESPWLSHCCK